MFALLRLCVCLRILVLPKQTTVYILQSSREFVPTQRLMKVGKTKLRTCDFVALEHTFRSPIINASTLMERS